MKLFGLLVASAFGNEFDAIIEEVNGSNAGWVAGQNFAEGTTLEDISKLCGSLPNSIYDPQRGFSNRSRDSDRFKIVKDIPASFDSRTNWPNCSVIGQIRDQGACGSCWAFGAAEMFSDRVCIATNGKINTMYSAEDLTSCCESCGAGCDGGFPLAAMDYIASTGLPTGGLYGDTATCKPYTLQPCEHHVPGDRPPCTGDGPTPACTSSCIPQYTAHTYKQDKAFGDNGYSIPNDVAAIQQDIMTYGPVEAAFTVYADFPSYKSGVYKHTSGQALGGHAIKIIGWGTENGEDYWLVNNSWNSDWGDNGTFKILRGSDECGIEDEVVGVHYSS